MEKYRWYWRIESIRFFLENVSSTQTHWFRPDVHFHCDVRFDPFIYMQEHNKVYVLLLWPFHILTVLIMIQAFTIALYEFEKTIPSLWGHVKGWNKNPHTDFFWPLGTPDFIKLYPQYLAEDNAMRFLSDSNGDTYNLCHCEEQRSREHSIWLTEPPTVWSNFEIADMSFWRGEAYTKFFEYLDEQGGFYYEVCCYFFLLNFTGLSFIAMGRCSNSLHSRSAICFIQPNTIFWPNRVRT